MKADIQIWELAEAYISGTISDAELVALEQRLETDPAFAVEFQECLNLVESLENNARQKNFVRLGHEVAADQKNSGKTKTIPLRTHYFRTAAIAAGIAILTTLSTVYIVSHSEQKRTSQYRLLKRELETIKRSHHALVKNINVQHNSPVAPANISGTGFALTNDGYFVTNYHVTEGADSVYIQDNEGRYYKAHIISFDAQSDVALLKVDKKGFKFSKTDVPYTLATGKRSLGTRVFTLGYPQDEIVYNEGYISSRNGYQGDSVQYRLELPAKAGQSGAPVIDAKGQVIGIVTGKETESEGATFAVGSEAIINLLDQLPKEQRVKLAKTNKLSKASREQQLEKLEAYTFAVKVYKGQ